MTANDSPADETDTADRLIAKIRLPAEAVGLATALQATSTIIVEGEQLIPNWNDQLPYLWVTGSDLTTFEDAVTDDPTVIQIHRVATFNAGNLYELEWEKQDHGIRAWLQQAQIPILEAEATGKTQNWQLKLRLTSREQLTEFHEYCDRQGFTFDLLRLYRLDAPKMGQYNVSTKQREALLVAYQMGYFEIPRACKLSDVAEKVGISTRAISERLRRGEMNLLTNTLLIGSASTANSTA